MFRPKNDGLPRCTCGKVRHATHTEAILVIIKPGREEIRSYRCRTCGGWHTTSQSSLVLSETA